MATARSLIRRALRVLEVISSGDTVDGTTRETELLETLNSFLGSCGAEKLLIPVVTSESFSLVAGTNTYTIGSSGTFNTVRPIKIVDAFIRDSSNNDYPLTIISKSEYNNEGLKTSQGNADVLEYSPEYPLGKIRLYPTPDAVETLFIDSWKPLSTIALITDTVSLPPMYEDFIVYNFAINIAPEVGQQISKAVGMRAEQTKKNIKTANLPTIPTASFDSALVGGYKANILNG